MEGRKPVQHPILRAAFVIAAAGLAAACQMEPPTPIAMEGIGAEIAAPPGPDIPQEAPVAKRGSQQIVVEAGQSLSRIAAKYGMTQRTIIAANNLEPPYKIKIGQRLVIPGESGSPPARVAAGSSPPEPAPIDRPAPLEAAASPPAVATAPPPAAKPIEVAVPAADKKPEPLPPVAAASTPTARPSESVRAVELPAPAAAAPPPTTTAAALPAPAATAAAPPVPATTAAVPAPTAVPTAPPPGVTCPAGTTGMWSERDITRVPLYICRKSQSQG
jgi:murein DD-endopeptidase MepM/ murein hydrolase activator NlpD